MSKVSRLLARPLATLLAIAMTMTGMPGVAYAATPNDGEAYVDENADAVTPDSTVTDDGAEAVSEEGFSDVAPMGAVPENAIVVTISGAQGTAGITKNTESVTGNVPLDALYTTPGTKIEFETTESNTEGKSFTAKITLTAKEGTIDQPSDLTSATGSFEYTVPSDNVSAVDIVVTSEVNAYKVSFTGIENAEVLTTKESNETPAVALDEENKAGVNYNDSLYFTVTPDTGYEIKSVKIGETDVAKVSADSDVYKIESIQEDKEVVVVIAKEQVKLTVTGNIASVSYQEYDGESTVGEAKVDETPDADGNIVIDVNKGDTIKITAIKFDNEYDMVTAVKQGTTTLDAEGGVYQTAAISADAVLSIETGNMPEADIALVANSDITNGGLYADADCIVEDGEEGSEIAYVKRDTNYVFTVTGNIPADKKITKLVYAVGDAAPVEIKEVAGKYTIPKAVIFSAVKDSKKINVTATVEKTSMTVTLADKSNIKSITYKEYTVSYDSDGKATYTVTEETKEGAEVSVTGNIPIEVGTGNVVEFHFEANDDCLFTTNSINGAAKVAAGEEPFAEGNYKITADADKTVTVKAFKAVKVVKDEAKDTTVTGNTPDTTATTISSGIKNGADSTKITTGDAIEFTVAYADPYTDYEVIMAEPTAFYTSSEGTDTALNVTKESAGYKIAQSEIERAIEAGAAAITVKANATMAKMYTATITASDDVESINFTEYYLVGVKNGKPSYEPASKNNDKKITPTKKTDEDKKTAEISFRSDSLFEFSELTIAEKYKNVDFFRADVDGKQITTEDGSFELNSIANGASINLATARIKKDEVQFIGSSSLSNKPVAYGEPVDVVAYPERYETITEGTTETIYFRNDQDVVIAFSTYGPDSNVKRYVVSNPQYTVNGDKAKSLTRKVKFNESDGREFYCIPVADAANVAFAETKTETPYAESPDYTITYKATITASAVQNGNWAQPIIISDASSEHGFTVSAKDNGKSVDLSESPVFYTTGITGADQFAAGKGYYVEYGHQGVITVDPTKGYALKSVGLISSADYIKVVKKYSKTISSGGSSYTQFDYSSLTDAQKTAYNNEISKLAKEQKISDDGTATITINSVNNAYAVVVATAASYTLTLDGKAVSKDNSEANPVDVKYGSTHTLKVVSGASDVAIDALEATIATVSGDVPVTADVFAGFNPGETSVAFTGVESVQGKVVKVTIPKEETVTGNVPKSVYIRVSDKLAADSLKVPADYLTEGKLVLEAGATKTITLDGNVDSSRFAALINNDKISVTQSAETVSGNTVNKLTFSTKAKDYNELKNAAPKLTLMDVVNDEIIGDEVPVQVVTNALSTASLKVVPVATANSIVLTISGLSKQVKSLDGLYYVLNLSTDDADTHYRKNFEDILIPVQNVDEQVYTVKLAIDSDNYDPNPVQYTGTVALVQLSGDGIDTKIAPAADNAITLLAEGLKTKANTYTVVENGESVEKDVIFATKLTVNKLAAKTKIYTGMDPVDLVSISYPDPAKNLAVTDYAKRLQKVVLTDAKGNPITSTDDDQDKISEEDNVITVYPENIPAGSYKVVAYALEPLGKEVTASYAFKVLQGIDNLVVTVPTTKVYKVPNKAASVKATLTYEPAKPATKKVTWTLRDSATDEVLNVPGITIKNGTVNIAKTVVFDEDLSFYVEATAADYEGNEAYGESNIIVLTNTEMKPAYLTLGGKPIGDKNTYVSGDVDGKELATFTQDDEIIDDISYKVSGAAKLEDGKLVVTKLGKVNITATTTDGSKKSLKLGFTVASDTNLIFEDSLRHGGMADVGTTYNETNDEVPGSSILFAVKGYDKNSLINHSFSVKGAKITRKVVQGSKNVYEIVPNAHITTVTIVDKSVKPNVKFTITYTNSKITAEKASTTVTASNKYDSAFKNGEAVLKDNKGKIFSSLVFNDPDAYKAAGAYNDVTYTVSVKGTDVSRVLVNVTKDDGSKLAEVMRNITKSDGTSAIDADGYVVLENGTFTVSYTDGNGNFKIANGKYTFNVTPVDENGNAIAKTKTITLTAAAAPKGKVTVKSTALKNFDKEQELIFNAQTNIVVNGTTTTAHFGVDGKPNVLGINTKGVINRFASYFDVVGEKLVCKLAPEIKGGYTRKAGISGWVAYTYQNLDGSMSTLYVKVKVTPAKDTDITAK